ncbi:MAG: TolC family protein [Microbacter sp.]
MKTIHSKKAKTFSALQRFTKTDWAVRCAVLIVLPLMVKMAMAAPPQKELTYYIAQAETNSPLINKTLNDNKVVDLNLQEVKKILYDPTISVNAAVMLAPIISHDNGTQFQWASGGATKYNGYDLAVTNGGQYQGVISVQQPLFKRPAYRTYEQKAAIDRKKNDNAVRLTKHDIEQLVTHQYLLCLNSATQMETTRQIIQELSGQLNILKTLVANAVYKQTDEMLLEIEYENYQNNYAAQHATYLGNLYDLNALCGIQDTAEVALMPTNMTMNALPTKKSYFETAYQLDSLALVSDLKINNLKYQPQVTAFADGGMNAAYLPTLNRLGFSAGLTFSWTIFDGHQRKIVSEKTHYGLQTISFEKQNFLKQQSINKLKIIQQINALNEQLQNLNNQLTMYKQLMAAYELQLAHGNISVMDYKNALKDAVTKQQEVNLLQIEKESLISSYNYWNY